MQRQDPEVSVVVPLLNEQDNVGTLHQQITQALANNYDYEVIYVDDGSSDNSLEVLTKLHNTDSRISIICFRKNFGQTAALSAGFAHAKGKIIAFTDDDCVLDPVWTQAVYDAFERNPVIDCVCGQSIPANHKDRPKQAQLSTLKHKRQILLRGRHNPIAVGRGNNMAFRTSAIARFGWFNDRIGVGTTLPAGDDMEIIYRLLREGGTACLTPDSVVYHSHCKA